MYRFIVQAVVWLLLAVVFTVDGADLTLKNGQVYKNYRIKTIQAEKVLIAFIAADGSPDIAEINLTDLPKEVARALGISDVTVDQTAKVVGNEPEKVTAQISEKLKNDLALLPADDVNGKRQLVIKAADDLKKNLALYYSDAEFETVWNGTDGIIAKVTRINRSAFLKLNELVFIRSASQLGNRFRAQVYVTGCMMQFGNNEMLPVLTFDENSAVKFALENILSVIGDKALLQPANNSNSVSAGQNSMTPASAAQPALPVINNYYFYDDNADDDIVYVIRDGRRYILPYRRPGNRPALRPGNRPVVKPENRPEVRPEQRPNRPVNPPPSRPSIKDKFSKDKSVIQRNDKKIHSYDHLPDWAQPRSARP